jgi:hypothetical protein
MSSNSMVLRAGLKTAVQRTRIGVTRCGVAHRNVVVVCERVHHGVESKCLCWPRKRRHGLAMCAQHLSSSATSRSRIPPARLRSTVRAARGAILTALGHLLFAVVVSGGPALLEQCSATGNHTVRLLRLDGRELHQAYQAGHGLADNGSTPHLELGVREHDLDERKSVLGDLHRRFELDRATVCLEP